MGRNRCMACRERHLDFAGIFYQDITRDIIFTFPQHWDKNELLSSFCPTKRLGVMPLGISRSPFHVPSEPLQRNLNKRKHLLRSLVHTLRTIWLLFARGEIHLTTTTTKKAMCIESGKQSQLAFKDVALKITLFRCLDLLQMGIMKLKMIIFPLFYHFSLPLWVCVCVYGDVPQYSPSLMVFCPA